MTIVSHRLYLKTDHDESVIDIHVHRPRKVDAHWLCRYEIGWPEGHATRDAAGHDALQALMLALQMIGAEIYGSSYHREGRLRAYERERGYGFPVPSSLRDRLVGVDAI